MNSQMSVKRKTVIVLLQVLCQGCAAMTCGLVLFLLVYVLAKGIPNVSVTLLTTKPST